MVNGCLMRIDFKAETSPMLVADALKVMGAKVRDDFPSRGNFGKKETKLARALTIIARVTESGKFIDVVAQNGEDLSISVTKKKADDFAGEIKALGKVHEKNLAKLEKVMAEKGNATIILSEDEQFGVQFWTTDDGKAFYDGAVAEPPAPKIDDAE